jgi:hypothetical protein
MNSKALKFYRYSFFLMSVSAINLLTTNHVFAETFEQIPNAAISGFNDKHLLNVSVNDCKTACISETTFHCKSFDYYKGLNKCDLSSKNAESAGNLKYDYANHPYDHYVRTNGFSRIPNAAISGYNNVQLIGVTAQQCQDACLNRVDFYCKSFDYYNAQAKCDLSSANAVTAGGLYSSVAYDHHVRELPKTAQCSPWDGSTPAIGSLLRFKNKVVKDNSPGPNRYRVDLANKYLINTLHGSDPVPKFLSEDSFTIATLYEVVDSRSTTSGPEIILKSPSTGLASGTAVGFNGTELITSAHSHWPISSSWIRLAHTYRAWIDPKCLNCAVELNDKIAPVAVMQRLDLSDTARSCAQEWYPAYQFTRCNDYYVKVGGNIGEQNIHLAKNLNDVVVESCTISN